MEKTTPKRTLFLSVAAGAVCLLVFGLVGAWNWWQQRQVPSGEPHFHGHVVEASGGGFLVQSPNGGRCFVLIQPDTRVRRRNGSASEIAVGNRVSVWHTSIVLGTDPPKVFAEWVIIEINDPRV